MSPYARKANYVRHAKQTRNHECHWPGCKEQVPPAKWGCTYHWFRLPKSLRDALWMAYKVGQEETGDVSKAYLEAADAIQKWIADFKSKFPLLNK